MKLLMLSPHPPYPPNSGGRIRQWEQIRYLGARHDLTVVCYAFNSEEFEQRSMLNDLCQSAVVVRHPGMDEQYLAENGFLPAPVKGYFTRTMQQAIQKLVRQNHYDRIIVENIFMAPFVDSFFCPAILQEYNIESRLYMQYARLPQRGPQERALWKATWMLMAEYENRIWPAFPLRTVVSVEDQQEIDARCSSGKTVLIENGVNVKEIGLVPLQDSRRILFMGSLDYFPNSDAAFYLVKEIMPFVWKQDSSISLCIAGRNPHPVITGLASDPRVEVIPNPSVMSEIAAQCCVVVVPMRIGGGTRIKILDSLAMGLPTITTSVGCGGLRVVDEEHVLIRNEPEDFASAIVRMIQNAGLRERMRIQGRELVEKHYDWDSIFVLLEQELLKM